MTDAESKSIRPRGPVSYDLPAMPPVEFERMCFRLVRLEHPEVEKPADTQDGGADALLPTQGGGYKRAWQAKRFSGSINWTQCKRSFEVAVKNFSPDEYTFCFPRDLTKAEQKTFDKHFRDQGNPVKVNYWNGSELLARLTESVEGRTVAKTFFDDNAEVLEKIARATAAKGALDTPGDALERIRPVGEFLATHDAYFTYPASTHATDQPGSTPPAESVMSVATMESGITTRYDVVPRDAEAMELYGPKGKLVFDREKHAEAIRALEAGEPVVAEDVEVTWEQLPPALKEEVGKPIRGRIQLGAAEPAPQPAAMKARVTAARDGDRVHLHVDLKPVAAPADWEGCLEGRFGGLRIRLLFRRTQKAGEMTLNYHWSFVDGPIEDHLRALKMLDLIARGANVSVEDRNDPDRRVDLESASDQLDPPELLLRFVENLHAIEEWTGKRLRVGPDHFVADEIRAAAILADAVRREGMDITLNDIKFEVTPEGLEKLRAGGPIIFDQEVSARILGQEFPLGVTRVGLDEYSVTDLGPGGNDTRRVKLEPPTEDAKRIFQSLAKPRTVKPPPKPPRKRAKKRSRRRGR